MKKIKISEIPEIPASHENESSPGVWKRILFTTKDFPKNGKIQMINFARLPKGSSFSSHYHEDMQEVYILLSGQTKMQINNEETKLIKGDAVVIPIGAVHKMTNLGNDDAEYIIVGVSLQNGGKTIRTEVKI